MAFIDNCFTAMVFRNLYQAYLLKVGLMQISAYHTPLSTTCHVGLHVDFSSTSFSLGFRLSPPSVK
jgi:hypothetical protein